MATMVAEPWRLWHFELPEDHKDSFAVQQIHYSATHVVMICQSAQYASLVKL